MTMINPLPTLPDTTIALFGHVNVAVALKWGTKRLQGGIQSNAAQEDATPSPVRSPPPRASRTTPTTRERFA